MNDCLRSIATCILALLCISMAGGSVVILISGIRTIARDLKECNDKDTARMIISSLIHDTILVLALVAAAVAIVIVGIVCI